MQLMGVIQRTMASRPPAVFVLKERKGKKSPLEGWDVRVL